MGAHIILLTTLLFILPASMIHYPFGKTKGGFSILPEKIILMSSQKIMV